ncbi:thioester-containing protein 1 allele R1-like [Cochliomyia hominivorax]
MTFKTGFKLLILLHYMVLIICENYYSILAPGVMKSNRKYNVIITLHDSETPCIIRVGVGGRSYNNSDEVELQPFETKMIEFFPPKLEKGDYKLLAEGVKGCAFRNESELYIESDVGPKIYIQTDKSVYKPMDIVRFRVVILDEHTRPVNIKEPIRVEIYDNDKNRVKQFKDITLTKGVFTGQFQLSQQPVMGDWEIRVIISGRYFHQRSKKILVKLYTLPKFSVYIKTPENLVIDEPILKAEIYGKYTFDKYVKGTLNVELGDYYRNTLIETRNLQVDGLAIVEFKLDPKKLEKVYDLYLKASLEEKDTGISQSYKKLITVRKMRYKILIPDDEIEFRNNKPFRLRAHVEDWNDGPIWDSSTPIVMEHGDKKYETYLDENGVAVFEFDHQSDADHEVIFKGAKVKYPNIFVQEESHEIQYCKLTLIEKPRLGKPLEIQVRSSFNIPYLVYTVVGHAGIVRMDHIKVPPNRKMHIIKINPSVEMIPTSYLYVHYVLDGNLRYEELTLKFPEELENLVSISAPKQAKPGKEVTLNVKAQPNSYVSILAVDLSVYLLDNKYDLYKKDILEDLENDKLYIPDAYIIRPGIISGLITLTNARYPIKKKSSYPVLPAALGPLLFRTKFPETWIFDNYIINNTETEIVLNIPETITTWRITAFSNNDVTGFGIVDGPTDITTILPFFITFALPYSVKRDEIITIPITLFNYYNQSLDTEIIIYNTDLLFYFMEDLNKYSSSTQQTKIMTIPADSSTTVKFFIKPLQIGEIEIRVSAQNPMYSDGVVKILNVIPEGITKYQNRAVYLNASEAGDTSLSLDLPHETVSDSEIISLSVGGDFMLPTLNNLNDIIKMPTGSGEQNMVNFAGNILILDYLNSMDKLSKETKLVNQVKQFIEIGYQQQLSYRHPNGGFCNFVVNHSEEVSTWLTAYVTRFLIKASEYIPIENRIIESALEYLANGQLEDGSFPFKGHLFYKELNTKYGFTAFVLLTFMEDPKLSLRFQTNILKGLNYLTADLNNINDVYELSLIANTLSKAQHPAANKIREKLTSFRNDNENGLIWWMGSGNDVETTAYTLMSLLDVRGNYLPIMKWLIEQRNEEGGFKSSHDTVVGLEALVKFSQKYKNSNNLDMKIMYFAQDQKGNEKETNEFFINRRNALKLQQHELSRSVRQVNFKIEGNGYSLVQLSSRYNINNDDETKHFVMKVKPTLYDGQKLDLDICFTYHALMQDNNYSANLVIMEANLPTGFKTETEMNKDLLENEFIQRIESKDDDTKMFLYFDQLSMEENHCVKIETFKSHEVEEYKPAAIVMYDYYNTSRSNVKFYSI